MVYHYVKQLQERFNLFPDGDRYHTETCPLICRANQWTGFCMITAIVMKELISFSYTMKLFLSGSVMLN